MNFHKPSLKLASLYLLIMMTISLFFSVALYQLSVQELGWGLRRPEPSLNRNSNIITQQLRNDLEDERESIYEAATERVFGRLVLVNLIILVAGGATSYYLARRTLKPIEEAHGALERFTADASHELRTPITAMRTEIEVALMDSKLTLSEAKKILGSNIEELTKLSDLTEGLLRLAQLGNEGIQRAEIDVNRIIAESIEQVTPHAERNKISISVKSEPELKIVGDQTGLKEVLIILLDNAIKYSSKNSDVTVTAEKSSKSVNISVKDSGSGIKASELPYIFERFYRADTARTKQATNGYGIGLAIAQSIVNAHDGKISVSSKPGKGSSFTLTLPVVIIS